jgi:hypothetical protein
VGVVEGFLGFKGTNVGSVDFVIVGDDDGVSEGCIDFVGRTVDTVGLKVKKTDGIVVGERVGFVDLVGFMVGNGDIVGFADGALVTGTDDDGFLVGRKVGKRVGGTEGMNVG